MVAIQSSCSCCGRHVSWKIVDLGKLFGRPVAIALKRGPRWTPGGTSISNLLSKHTLSRIMFVAFSPTSVQESKWWRGCLMLDFLRFISSEPRRVFLWIQANFFPYPPLQILALTSEGEFREGAALRIHDSLGASILRTLLYIGLSLMLSREAFCASDKVLGLFFDRLDRSVVTNEVSGV